MSREEADGIKAELRPIQVDLRRLRDRISHLAWPEADAFYRAVQKTEDAIHNLTVIFHQATCAPGTAWNPLHPPDLPKPPGVAEQNLLDDSPGGDHAAAH